MAIGESVLMKGLGNNQMLCTKMGKSKYCLKLQKQEFIVKRAYAVQFTVLCQLKALLEHAGS